MARSLRVIIWLALVALAFVVLHQATLHKTAPREFAWGEFVQQMRAGRVLSLTVDPKNIGTGEYKDDSGRARRYTVVLPDDKRTYVADANKYIGANFGFQSSSGLETWAQSFVTLLAIGLPLLGFWLVFWLLRKAAGRGRGVG